MRRSDMVHMVIAWNPVNFIDGEARWIAWAVTYVVIGLVLSKALAFFLHHLSRRIKTTSFNLFADALLCPTICLIWYLVALHSLDLVTEDWISQTRPRIWAVVTNGGCVIALGWFLLRLKNRLLEDAIKRRTQEGRIPDANSMQAVSKLSTIGIFAVVLVLFNDFTGLSLTTLLAFGGVGGLALAFASQEIVSNFFGGFMIHTTRPFLVGELVQMPSLSIEGVVEEIGWYQTRIRPSSKSAVYIPNSLFTKALLVNKTRITHRLLEESIYITVSPFDALSAIIRDIDAYLSSHPLFDRTEWASARIEFVGPTSTVVLSGLTRAASLQEFYRLKNEVLLRVAQIVSTHGGHMSFSPHSMLSVIRPS
jgi:MscS family membrane protein